MKPETRDGPAGAPRENLAERGLSALKWNYLGAAVKILSQVVIGVVLARILGPEPFGLLGIAWIIIGFGFLVSDMGFSTALVQRPTIDEQDIRYVFAWVWISAIVMSGLTMLSAPMVASFFRRPDAVPIIRVLALYFVFQAMGQVSQSLLRRRMDFRTLQRSHIASYLTAYVVLGIPLALAGFGAWSLVVAALSQVLIGGWLMFASAPHSLRPALRPKSGGYMSFGAKVMGTNVASHVMSTADAMVVGRAFGAVDLGVYNRTITLLFTSMMAFVSTLTSVLMPAYSRAQDNILGARKAYLASLTLVALLCAPPLLTAMAAPETVILGLFGVEWIAAAKLLGPLALACLCAALTMVGGPLITGLGRPGTDFRVNLIAATLMVPIVILAAMVSLAAVAWATAAAFFVRFALMLFEALRLSGGKWSEAAEALFGPLLVSVGTAIVIRVLDAPMALRVPIAPLRLALEVVAGLVVAAGVAWLCRTLLLTVNVRWLLERIAGRLPRAVVRHLGISRS